MNSTRKIAVISGVIFIIATVAALLAAVFVPVFTGTDYLTLIYTHSDQVAVGAILYLIAAFTSAGIAISMYPVLKGLNSGLALGSVVFRAMEAVMYMVAVVSLLSLLTLSKQVVTTRLADSASLKAIGDSFRNARDIATLTAVFAFCIGAFMYYYLFFQSRLIPRWLSGWGIFAIILMMTACISALFSGNPITGYTLLVIPIALQEMVLAVWLIVKGFNQSVIASVPL